MLPDYIQRLHMRRGMPPDPCLRCYDTTDTFFLTYGDLEWTAGAIAAVTGIDTDEALGTAMNIRREHNTPPDERHPARIRLCARCMAQSKVTVSLYTEAQLAAGGEFDGIAQTNEHMRRALTQ